MYPLLDTISFPSQLRELNQKKLPQVAKELRGFLIESVAKTGGHQFPHGAVHPQGLFQSLPRGHRPIDDHLPFVGGKGVGGFSVSGHAPQIAKPVSLARAVSGRLHGVDGKTFDAQLSTFNFYAQGWDGDYLRRARTKSRSKQ